MSSNQKSNFSLVVYISRTKEKKNGEVPVLMKININGERVVMQLQRSIHPNNWDSKRAKVIGRSHEAREFNDYIDSVITRTRQKYSELITMHDTVTPQLLRDAVLGVNTAKARTVIDICEDHIEGLRKLIGKENTYATYQKYKTAKNHFKKFLQKYYRVNDISIKALEYHMIQQYNMFLKTEMGCSYNTATKFLQNLKRITCISIRSGWLIKDPFVGVSLSMKEVDRPYLTMEEIQRLIDYSSPCDRLNKVRDFFIFSCFTGLAYIDVKKLKKAEVEGNDELGYWIRTRRKKTGGRANIPILDIPMGIINNYCRLDLLLPEDPILPILSNQKMNAYLKELADLCGIHKQLTYHVARHTFATTVTMMNGVPMETVSKMLGHKNIKSTQHYARIVDQKVGEDMKLLADKLKGNRQISFAGIQS
jgi:site-specific recombinase XerD